MVLLRHHCVLQLRLPPAVMTSDSDRKWLKDAAELKRHWAGRWIHFVSPRGQLDVRQAQVHMRSGFVCRQWLGHPCWACLPGSCVTSSDPWVLVGHATRHRLHSCSTFPPVTSFAQTRRWQGRHAVWKTWTIQYWNGHVPYSWIHICKLNQ